MVFERDGKSGDRTIIVGLVERLGAGEIKFFGVINIRNVDRVAVQRGVGCQVMVIGLSRLLVIQGQRRERDLPTGGATHGHVQRVRTHNGEPEAVIVGKQIQGGSIRVAEGLSF